MGTAAGHQSFPIHDIRKNRGDNPLQDSPVKESVISLFNENTTPDTDSTETELTLLSLGWMKISPVHIQDLDHNPGVLLWSGDIASPVQIVADPLQTLFLMLTGLKIELHSVA
jgi:hypothetical protein